jgi:hypothetical protein
VAAVPSGTAEYALLASPEAVACASASDKAGRRALTAAAASETLEAATGDRASRAAAGADAMAPPMFEINEVTCSVPACVINQKGKSVIVSALVTQVWRQCMTTHGYGFRSKRAVIRSEVSSEVGLCLCRL